MEQKPVIVREPWPADPIDKYDSIDAHTWGFMTIYEDLDFTFDPEEVPTREQIKARWGHRFASN